MSADIFEYFDAERLSLCIFNKKAKGEFTDVFTAWYEGHLFC